MRCSCPSADDERESEVRESESGFSGDGETAETPPLMPARAWEAQVAAAAAGSTV